MVVREQNTQELEEGQCGWRAVSEGSVLRDETGAWQGKAKRHVKYFFIRLMENDMWHKVLVVP